MVARFMEVRIPSRSEIRASGRHRREAFPACPQANVRVGGLLGLHADQVLYSFGS